MLAVRQVRATSTARSFGLPILAGFGVAGLALWLRIWAIDWGRPFEYHPDENAIYGPVLNMLLRRDPNPHNFQYPSLLTNTTAIAFELVRRILGWPLVANALPTGANGSDLLPSLFPYLVVGRLVVAGFGVLSCILVVLALRRLEVGLAAAAVGGLMLAVAPLAVSNAHYLTTDVPSSTGCAIATLGVAGMFRGSRRLDAVIAGIGAGLAASAKYNAGLVLVVPLVAIALRHAAKGGSRPDTRDAFWVIVGAFDAFALTSPFFLLDPTSSIPWLLFQWHEYQGGHLGAQGSNSFAWYAWILVSQGWGFGLSALSILGAILGLVRRRYRRFTGSIVLFVVAYLALIGWPPTRFDRNLLPLLPSLAVMGGIGVQVLVEWVRERLTRARASVLIANIALSGALVAAIGPAFVADTQADQVLSREDTRSIAYTLAVQRLPPSARLVREWYTPQLEWTTMTTATVNTLSAHPLDWYRANGYDYLIASSYMFGRYFTDPAAPPASVQTYGQIFALPLVFEVKPGPDQPGPDVRVYRVGA